MEIKYFCFDEYFKLFSGSDDNGEHAEHPHTNTQCIKMQINSVRPSIVSLIVVVLFLSRLFCGRIYFALLQLYSNVRSQMR